MSEPHRLLIDFVEKYQKGHVLRLNLFNKTIFGYVDEKTLFNDLVKTFGVFEMKFDVRVLEEEVPDYLKYGTVITPTCDMRKFPSFESERVHQLIFNEKVKVLQIQTDYYLVKDLKSSYIGFVRAPQLRFNSKDHDDYTHLVTARFTSMSLENLDLILPFGTKLKIMNETDEFYFAETALGMGKLKKSDVSLISKFNMDFDELIKNYISTPYLWGGTSTLGTDCSGFIYRLYDALGVKIPRDTSQQFDELYPIDQDELTTGDLILFKGHVGMYIGENKMVHSSASLGGVYVSDIFDPKDIYEETLKRGIIGFRRVKNDV